MYNKYIRGKSQRRNRMKINQQEVPAEFKYYTKAQKVVNLLSRIGDYG